jgi:hypothetical protein
MAVVQQCGVGRHHRRWRRVRQEPEPPWNGAVARTLPPAKCRRYHREAHLEREGFVHAAGVLRAARRSRLENLQAESGTTCSLLRRRSLLDEGDDVRFDVDTLICGAFLDHWRVGAL